MRTTRLRKVGGSEMLAVLKRLLYCPSQAEVVLFEPWVLPCLRRMQTPKRRVSFDAISPARQI